MGETRTWVNFLASKARVEPAFVGSLVDGRVSRYRVDEVKTINGRGWAPSAGWHVTRVESLAPIPRYTCDVCLPGITQHVAYTADRDRKRLVRISRQSPGAIAVLIPVLKSEAWWSLAQDEREAHFRRQGTRPGHLAIGARFADRIARRLYHARYVPGSPWDFLTYFEFDEDAVDEFRQLLGQLRDTRRNPEWKYVEGEVEIWMRRA